MMRKAPSSSMQKTYDECYLICSTAIYFEGQNNEDEALRSWRSALDQIYYHNAYKMPSNYVPRTETEKALQDSLRAMELQCKERVDLLDALKKSRLEAEKEAKEARTAAGVGVGVGVDALSNKSRESLASLSLQSAPAPTPSNSNGQGTTWLGANTIPQATYSDIPRPQAMPDSRRPPPQPPRPSYISKKSSSGPVDTPRTRSLQSNASPSPRLTPPLPGERQKARTPSPEKKSGGMLKTLRSNQKDGRSSGKMASSMRNRPQPAAAKAASSVWSGPPPVSETPAAPAPQMTWDPLRRTLVRHHSSQQDVRRMSDVPAVRPPSPSDYRPRESRSSFEEVDHTRSYPLPYPDYPLLNPYAQQSFSQSDDSVETARPPPPPPHKATPPTPNEPPSQPTSLAQMPPTSLSYMKEYPNNPPLNPAKLKKAPPPVPGKIGGRSSDADAPSSKAGRIIQASTSPQQGIPRKAIGRAAGVVSATAERQKLDNMQAQLTSRTRGQAPPNYRNSSPDPIPRKQTTKKKIEGKPVPARAMTPPTTDENGDSDDAESPSEKDQWEQRVKKIMKKLPKGVDEWSAKQIFNEIVIQGDEVHWDDVAGLEIAKSALKETVVYPFLRPDLFMGLREPARGMLLFGPPGTGKTMLARAVATESKSVFFAISASSLTSKYLGESEKLVRALFVLAKELAPSIIFVDEIDSLLGSRGGSSEHEATRRIKTEFLIQWSDLQKAAAGRESSDGDASRVLVLAATNLPWAIDEAARRRFVRRQYIPLPEDWVREKQLRTLLAAQNHSLKDRELQHLVALTDGFSGSDITALAKDAAMGPLRSLGERLLHMKPEDIRPIGLQDFEASLANIRPSVSKAGLKEFEAWAGEFGERGG
ncbi:hypothetical protein AC578_3179 [Pseudocercospora eumusae]|uniref:AAA+ ATPase domain-containing protein n=1 Tax=Pseudocercospora eumusae TaxID=321146 RepID=A0A139GW04_9PEZI|nr:hypothetical protein AC578_3179 [Pseudocercospora eumusae]